VEEKRQGKRAEGMEKRNRRNPFRSRECEERGPTHSDGTLIFIDSRGEETSTAKSRQERSTDGVSILKKGTGERPASGYEDENQRIAF